MPATEQTWRSLKRMHVVFAVTSVLLLVVTLWMLYVDHARSWKPYQRQSTAIAFKTTEWRKLQAAASEAYAKREEFSAGLSQVRRTKPKLEDFKKVAEFKNDAAHAPLDRALEKVVNLCDSAKEKADAVAEAQKSVVDAETAVAAAETKAREAKAAIGTAKDRLAAQDAAKQAEEAAKKQQAVAKANRDTLRAADAALAAIDTQLAAARKSLVDEAKAVIAAARFEETKLLDQRKFANARLDANRAALGLLIRDSNAANDRKPEQVEAQKTVDKIQAEVDELTVSYQTSNTRRKQLQEELAKITASEDRIRKQLDDATAEVEQLAKSYRETVPTWFTTNYPLLGDKWLTLPIISAFNSPEKIEQIWLPEVTQDFNFKRVARFDRCITCHQMIQKTAPGSAVKPAYVKEHRLELTVLAPAADKLAELQAKDEAGNLVPANLRSAYGLEISSTGLINEHEAAVSHVLPQSLAARASVVTQPGAFTSEQQGLLVGDVIETIDGDLVTTAADVERLLLQPDRLGKPIALGIRRGLPNPYTSHPRLDLFVGDSSPHKMAAVGCTICHEGQDSGTAFKWASHSPNDLIQRQTWSEQYGWFENHDWRTPMNPKRFAETGCLKCHHEVVELRPSEKFPEPPAPKLMHGYDLIRKYGCFGCHEINGNDGPRRIGPDLRLEPNFTGAGLQLAYELRNWLPTAEKIVAEIKEPSPALQSALGSLKQVADLARKVGFQPDDREAREKLLREFDSAKERLAKLKAGSSANAALTIPDAVLGLQTALKDPDYPGSQRKVGPSLRFVGSKLDKNFLADWIREPKHFRPSTRMPQFFLNYKHLQTEESKEKLAEAKGLEAVEVQGLVAYLTKNSQPFEYLDKVEGAPAADKIRGRRQFETRGCLACHNLVGPQDRKILEDSKSEEKPLGFPSAADQRAAGEIVQGPDLSDLAAKFGDAARNPSGRKWLYSWIRQPSRYHPRTVMPDLFLEPIRDKDGKIASDPADDIVEFLLSVPTKWEPAAQAVAPVDGEQLDNLVLEHLKKAFYETKAKEYVKTGIYDKQSQDVKGPEAELLTDGKSVLTQEQKLLYVGRKAVSKYGCYACHDVPGFEDAKPIGTELSNWGRKDPSRLAFEHITHYLHEGHGHGGNTAQENKAAANAKSKTTSTEAAQVAEDKGESTKPEIIPAGDAGYYRQAIEENSRTGFIYQKLKEPRSYDYRVVENKKYNDWLRMPQFPLTHDEREAVITFVLGLVADPPAPKYVYKPNDRQFALLEGRKVLDKYNCAACHMLELEKIHLEYDQKTFKAPPQATDVFPFVKDFVAGRLTPGDVEKLGQPDRQRGMAHATLTGLPVLTKEGLPTVEDSGGEALEGEELAKADLSKVRYRFSLWEPVVVSAAPDGDSQGGPTVLMPSAEPVVPAGIIARRKPSQGGYLAKYLLPRVIEYAKDDKEEVKSAGVVWGWVPPPLVGQGRKVQGAWLHDFLLDPHVIRPATFLRMPKFNLSSDEASKLVNYFAAADNPGEPVAKNEQKSSESLRDAEATYRKSLAAGEVKKENGVDEAAQSKRFDDALTLVLSKTYCIQCHRVGDLSAGGSLRAQAPNLAEVHRRLRYDYVKRWIANPKLTLPYTAMPNNIAYDPTKLNEGAKTQEIHGTSSVQLEALTDFLMHFDQYAEHSKVAEATKLFQAAPATPSAKPGEGKAADDKPASGEPPANSSKSAPSKESAAESDKPAPGKETIKEPAKK